MPFPPVGVFAGQGIHDAVESQAGFKSQGSAEAALNPKVKNLIQKLGEAIHESVSESESIAGVVRNIREQGFDVLLMLEATIGLNEVAAEPGEATDHATEVAIGPFTRNDLTFLKSLRITLPESDSEEHSNSLSIGSSADSAAGPSTDA
jgi:hypothetical protein